MLPIFFGLVLFALRDTLGLAAFGNRGLRLAYGASLLAAGAILGTVAEQLSAADAQTLLNEPVAWAGAIAAHGLLWVLFERARRSDRYLSWPAWLFAIPAPLLLYVAGAATWQALRLSNLPGVVAGALIMAAYGATVLVAAFAVRRWAKRDAGPGAALRFAAVSNLSALLLVLLPHAREVRPDLALHVDWGESLAVLAVVSSMVGISFLVARRRGSH